MVLATIFFAAVLAVGCWEIASAIRDLASAIREVGQAMPTNKSMSTSKMDELISAAKGSAGAMETLAVSIDRLREVQRKAGA